ncbi:MAG TPA: nucleotidyltransferase domain-containing protein, partial [Bdellovibrionales bacterium]|nr:nucleotidyltransferase domain-containing protein [Bdellovibrionales bacterium]
MPNQLTDKERRVISDVLNKNLKDIESAEVILFGSLAQGKARATSDIDLAIKGAAPLAKSVWAQIESDFEESDLRREVDVVDYWRVNEAFQKVIDKDGEKILAAKSHPFRLCPIGYHWVSSHLRDVPPSLRNPDGGLTEVDGHCRRNAGKGKKIIRDVFTADELKEIFKRFGSRISGKLGKFTDLREKSWNRLDQEILFWTSFWNDFFQPEEKLDPNLVKALVATESSFNLAPRIRNAGQAGRARGLIQLTDQALAVLKPTSKELKDQYFEISPEDLADPNVSLAA